MINEDGLKNASREEIMSAIFAGMVNQYAQMAFMFMGKVPNPQTGKTEVDVESAKMFIDNLEMLEFKTKGNLSPEEDKFLKTVLTQLRMDFVESLEKKGVTADNTPSSEEPPAKESSQTPPSQESNPESGSGNDSDSDEKRKFVKRYN